jgi:hypothetical protein
MASNTRGGLEGVLEISLRVMTTWGKCMRMKITMNHKLGSHGYRGKRILWAKEDAVGLEAGITGPLLSLEPGHAKDFVRARIQIHPVTGRRSSKLEH